MTEGSGETGGGTTRPVWFAASAEALDAHEGVPATARAWIEQCGVPLEPGTVLRVPDSSGALAGVVFAPDPAAPLGSGQLARSLKGGTWRLETGALDERASRLAHLGVRLGLYRFDRYRTADRKGAGEPRFEAGPDDARAQILADGVALARDLINTPTSDMGPAELEVAARDLAARHGAEATTIEGDALLDENFPMIHAVGRASASAPRLIDMRWGAEDAPKVTLVGKGVCFDTGGLDLKSASNMLLMKKDMGGAAAVLGLAAMVMAARLPFRLRVLVPAVENSVSADAFRPSDILHSRKGLSVEVGNTDAEGRLVLADALALADEEEPELLIDMATLTGAARVALGPDVPPFLTRSDAFSDRIVEAADSEADPVWRLPLHRPYLRMLKSEVADTGNVGGGGMAGAITAALFLDRFVERAGEYAHFDIYGWCPEARPHCPKGGEAQAIRALFAMLEARR